MSSGWAFPRLPLQSQQLSADMQENGCVDGYRAVHTDGVKVLDPRPARLITARLNHPAPLRDRAITPHTPGTFVMKTASGERTSKPFPMV